jgi:hypothetical protein
MKITGMHDIKQVLENTHPDFSVFHNSKDAQELKNLISKMLVKDPG